MASCRRFRPSSLVGEIYRYQVVGPPHFGLTNLRTSRTGSSRGGCSPFPASCRSTPGAARPSNIDVDVDLHKLDAYNVTLPQVIAALGNANINVGGRRSLSASNR